MEKLLDTLLRANPEDEKALRTLIAINAVSELLINEMIQAHLEEEEDDDGEDE